MHGNTKYLCREVAFAGSATPDSAYWLGYLYADGYVSLGNGYKLGLSSVDYEMLEKFRTFLETDAPIRSRYKTSKLARDKEKRFVIHEIVVSSKRLILDLLSYGVVPRKSQDFSTPVTIPVQAEADFWRGCLDGDGSLSSAKMRREGPTPHEYLYVVVALYNNNSDLLRKFKLFAARGSVSLKAKHGPACTVGSTSAKTMVPFLDRLYKNAPVGFRLERKYQTYLRLRQLLVEGSGGVVEAEGNGNIRKSYIHR